MPSTFRGPLISIHDVMPETLDSVGELIGLVRDSGFALPALLVVPGSGWDRASLARLRAYADAGHELVGHGWSHRAASIRGFRHRLHSAVISRNAAEHLALDADGIAALIRRCAGWFADNELPAPTLYVPPAWALGSIPRARLAGLGFRYYETLAGIYDSETRSMQRIPVVGFEADTALRAIGLRVANAVNRMLARRTGTLRVAIHPRDLKLHLANELCRALRAPPRRDATAAAPQRSKKASRRSPA